MVILLDTVSDLIHKNLLKKVREVVPPTQLEEFHDFETLMQFLVRLLDEDQIMVLRVSSPEDFINYRRTREFMRDVQILLVMPDHQEKSLSLGHLLHPRFMTFEDGDFNDLASVLEKMLNNKDKNKHRMRK